MLLLRPLGQILRHNGRYAVRHMASGKKTVNGAGKGPGKPWQEQTQPEATQTAEAKPEDAQTTQTKQELPSLDIAPVQRTSARARTSNTDSSEEKRRHTRKIFLGLLGVAFIGWGYSLGREWTPEELRERKLDSQGNRFDRTRLRFSEVFDYFSKPAWRELLPPPYPPPQGKPYTLLLEIDDLLVTSTWDRQHGWRTAKRPGVDYFLAYISQFYEVVIFTTQNAYTAAPVLDALDRYNFFITHRLYREATRSAKGGIVKDLSYLNRDLSKVVVLDTDKNVVRLQPDNALIIPKWHGDSKDRGLIEIIPFLETLAIYKLPDVRPILDTYKDKNVAIEWARREEEAKQRHIEEWEKKHPKRGGVIGWIFGEPTPPPTYLEQKRAEAQRQYLDEQIYIDKHKDYLEKLLADEKRLQEEMVPSNLWEALDYFQGKPKMPKSMEGGQGKDSEGNVKVTVTPPSSSATSTK